MIAIYNCQKYEEEALSAHPLTRRGKATLLQAPNCTAQHQHASNLSSDKESSEKPVVALGYTVANHPTVMVPVLLFPAAAHNRKQQALCCCAVPRLPNSSWKGSKAIWCQGLYCCMDLYWISQLCLTVGGQIAAHTSSVRCLGTAAHCTACGQTSTTAVRPSSRCCCHSCARIFVNTHPRATVSAAVMQ